MKAYPDINYAFSPLTYWEQRDLLHSILRNVKGENRRQMILDYFREDRLDELEENLLQDEVDDETRKRLGGIHPSFMGGEYLPGYQPGEVEIARICLRSTTSDVISVRARPTAQGAIAYRVVDEYQEEFVLPLTESDVPLSLAEVIRLLDEGTMRNTGFPGEGGLSLGYNWMNAEDGRFEELRYFTRIESDVYPQLHDHYEQVFAEWVSQGVAERDAGPPKDDSEPT